MKKDVKNEYQPSDVNLDADNLETLSDTTKDKPYPKVQIILSYTLLGGMLGGLLVWLGIGIVSPEVLRSVYLLSTALGGGGIIGLIPTLITALIIVKLRIYRRNVFDYITICAIGAVSSAFFILAIVLFNNTPTIVVDSSAKLGIVVLLMGVIGGLSSLIIGWFVIPKRTDDAHCCIHETQLSCE